MKSALVTGGAGFIGSHIVDALLKKKVSVTVLDDFSSGRESNLIEAKKLSKDLELELKIVKGSIADAELWKNIPRHDALFHVAAQTSVTASVDNPEKDFSVNVQSCLYISKWLRAHKVNFVVYTNTAGALYGDVKEFPTTENTAPGPLAPYGATKSFFENYIRALSFSLKGSSEWSSNTHDKNYFSWASIRLGNVYGPRQITKGEAGVIPIFIETFAQKKVPTIFGDGNKTRDYIHVADVVNAAMTCFDKMQNSELDEAFNIATQVEIKDKEVFDQVFKNMKIKIPSLSPSLAEAKFAPVRPGEIIRSFLSNDKARKVLGWNPKYNFSVGVAETVQSYPLEGLV